MSTRAPRAARTPPSPKQRATALDAEPLALVDEAGHLLRRAHQAAVAAFHATHGRDVTPVQYAVLRTLADRPGIDQVTLADAVALDTSTTADIAARLDAKGWIERELLPRRQRALRLTPAGEAVLAAMLPQVRPMYGSLLAPLSAAERAQLLDLLKRIVQV
ncbi:MAG: MarR family transcriptional regulator [Rubrivivax sp.]|nr:MarR family transcriptional regulator [Rubrivivax sp.]